MDDDGNFYLRSWSFICGFKSFLTVIVFTHIFSCSRGTDGQGVEAPHEPRRTGAPASGTARWVICACLRRRTKWSGRQTENRPCRRRAFRFMGSLLVNLSSITIMTDTESFYPWHP